MMKKCREFVCRLALVAMAFAMGLSAVAQQFAVEGTVVDSIGSPEGYATVRVFALPDTVRPSATLVTDEAGLFSKQLKASGAYRLVVLPLGKRPVVRGFEVSAESPVAKLGKIQVAGNVLGEVVVTAQKPLISREIDRIAYDVQNDEESRTGTIDEILKKVPMVSVDPDGTIKIKGESGFKIYKNGRQNNAFTRNAKEIFKSLPANMIKSIEVITDPGAREDAEGTGMILNIVTMENTIIKGVMGSAGLFMSSTNNSPSPNLWLTTQIDKVTVSAYADLGFYPSRSNHQIHSTDREFESGNRSSESTEQHISRNMGNLGFEASWEIDTLNLITAEFNAYINSSKTRQTHDFLMAKNDGEAIYSYTADGLIKPDRSHWIGGNFNYQRLTRRKGEKIILSYMISGNGRKYTWLNDYSDYKDLPVDYTGINTESNATFLEHTVQLDWSRPLAKGHTLDVGGKYINRRNHSVATQEYLDADRLVNTDFSHVTQVAAAFFDYRFNIGRFGLRAGLRYEYSRLQAKYNDGSQPPFHADLNDWVPNAALSWNINDNNGIRIGYSTYINRPGISYLNPMVNNSPQSVSYGNPDLGSVRNQNLNFNYSYFTRKFNLDFNAGYSFAHNAIIDIKTVEDDITVNTFANGGRNRGFSSNLYMQWRAGSKTTLMFNGGINYNDYRNPASALKATGWTKNGFLRISQQLPWKLSLSGSLSYFEGSKGLYNVFEAVGSSKFYHHLQLQRSFLKENRLTVRIGASNPFGPGRSEYRSHAINVPYGQWSRSFTSNNRRFTLSLSYRFGSLNAQVKKVRKISNNDMIGGASR